MINETVHFSTTMAELHSMFSNLFIHSFIVLVFADLLLGYVKSYVTHTVNSAKGISGILKHSTVVLVLLTLYYFTDIAGANFIGSGFIGFVMIQYANSCVENWVSMGLPFPDYLQNMLDRLTDEEGKNLDFKSKKKTNEMINKIKKNDRK